jgi:hypothetical protein
MTRSMGAAARPRKNLCQSFRFHPRISSTAGACPSLCASAGGRNSGRKRWPRNRGVPAIRKLVRILLSQNGSEGLLDPARAPSKVLLDGRLDGGQRQRTVAVQQHPQHNFFERRRGLGQRAKLLAPAESLEEMADRGTPHLEQFDLPLGGYALTLFRRPCTGQKTWGYARVGPLATFSTHCRKMARFGP